MAQVQVTLNLAGMLEHRLQHRIWIFVLGKSEANIQISNISD